jgi:hypothetical protein
VPCGYIRTVPYFADYYTVDLTNSAGGTAYTFDNYRLCTWTVTNVSFTINKTRTTTDLRGQTHQGDTVTANFTIAGTQSGYVSLVAYDAPAASFSANTASQQVIDSQVGGMFAPGAHSLTVTLPNNYYQIDFIRCVPIDHFGPAGSNIFFSAEGRLISADNAGLHSDIEDMSAATKFWANLGQTLIGSFNVTDANPAPTALGNWLAQSFPALYGPSSGNDLTGATNAKVASLYLSLYNNSAKSTDVQVLATALNVYSTTLGLGGNAAVSYGFDVSTAGLGASTFNIGSCGQAFNVANNTTLSIWQMLQATNMDSKNGVLYNGVPSLLSMACGMYLQINSDGGVS